MEKRKKEATKRHDQEMCLLCVCVRMAWAVSDVEVEVDVCWSKLEKNEHKRSVKEKRLKVWQGTGGAGQLGPLELLSISGLRFQERFAMMCIWAAREEN